MDYIVQENAPGAAPGFAWRYIESGLTSPWVRSILEGDWILSGERVACEQELHPGQNTIK